MKPLSYKSRLLSLIILFFVFLIIGPMLLAYSQGYRITDSFKLLKTGGIYIHSEITNADVYLNDEFIKSNGVFIRNTFVQDLQPEEIYQVAVLKDGYHTYRKQAEVFPSFVTELRVLMLPEEIEKVAIFPFIDNETGLGTTTKPLLNKLGEISASSTILINADYENYLELFNLASTTEEIAEAKKNISTNLATTTSTSTIAIKEVPDYFLKIGIEDPDSLKNLIINGDEVSWLNEDGDILIYWIGKSENIPFYYCHNEKDCRENIMLEWYDKIQRFNYLPGRNDVWVVLIKDGIYAVEVDDRFERNIQPIYLGENLDFRINSNNRIVVKDGEIFYELRI